MIKIIYEEIWSKCKWR